MAERPGLASVLLPWTRMESVHDRGHFKAQFIQIVSMESNTVNKSTVNKLFHELTTVNLFLLHLAECNEGMPIKLNNMHEVLSTVPGT